MMLWTGRGCARWSGRCPPGGRISDEVIDQLLADASTEQEIVGPGGLLAELTRRLVERAMEAELGVNATNCRPSTSLHSPAHVGKQIQLLLQ